MNAASAESSANAKAAKIEINLFGHPCIMSGPFEKGTLQVIHSISPERVPRILTSKEAARFVKTFEEAQGKVPATLDDYRKKMLGRLRAQAVQKEEKPNEKKDEKSNSSYPAYPEELFHQVTRSLGIEYNCEFEDNS